eukprot:scaffold15489_cov53-Attheya_sp.AAC.1
MTTDWDRTNYCGLTLKWNYKEQYVDMSLPGNVERALHRFQHSEPPKLQHAPSKFVAPNYGATQQLTSPEDTTPLLPAAQITRIHEIVGVFLYYYYGRAVDNTMLVALGSITSTKTTEEMDAAVTHFLNYASSNL